MGQQGQELVLTAIRLTQMLGQLHLFRDGRLQLRGALGDPLLELAIQSLRLPRLAVELGEDANFGAQQLRDHRHRDVVHRPGLVALEPVEVGQVHRRDEDDRRLLIARMLPDDLRQLEAVQLRHADVHQHDRDVGLEQKLERLASRAWP